MPKSSVKKRRSKRSVWRNRRSSGSIERRSLRDTPKRRRRL
jgi:hypothetical protein